MIQTLIGSIEVRRQKVRDRETNVLAEAKILVTSNILPKWARRCKSLDALLPVLYLRGISPSCARSTSTASTTRAANTQPSAGNHPWPSNRGPPNMST